MYCATCSCDASYCPPQPDGTYLCPGCAGFAADLDDRQETERQRALASVDALVAEARAAREADNAEYHRAGRAGELSGYHRQSIEPWCNHCGNSPSPINADGSCGSCGYL